MKGKVCKKTKCKSCRRKNAAIFLLVASIFLIIGVPTIKMKQSYGFYTFLEGFDKLGLHTDLLVVQTYKLTDDYDVFSISEHEIGHYVWYRQLNDTQREEWIAIYESSNETEFYSDYAASRPEEDFAETFEASMQTHYQPNFIRHISPRRAEFLDKYYGVYNEPTNTTE